MQLCLERRVRNVKLRIFALAKRYTFGRRIENQKRETTAMPRNHNRSLWERLCVGTFQGPYLEISLDDKKRTDKILEVLGCDGALQLHLANENSHCAI